MKNRIVILCLILLVLMNGAIFAGGGGQSSTSGSAAGASGSVNLRFAWWGNNDRHERTIKAIELYESKNPGVKIEPEPRGTTERDKIAAELAGGTVADISQLNSPWMWDFTQGVDFFVDLGTKSSILNTADFDQNFLRENCYYNSKLLALPLGLNYLTAYLDKHLAERFNIPTDLSSTSWTWENFRDIGKAVNAQDSKYYFLNIEQQNMLEFILRPFLAQRTGKQLIDEENISLNITRDDMIVGLTYVASLYSEKVCIPAQEANIFNATPWNIPYWVNREAVYGISWTSMYSTVIASFKDVNVPIIGVLPIASDAKDTGIPIQPQALVSVSNKSRGIDEAVRFVSWFLNDLDAAKILGITRSIPPSTKVQDMLVKEGLIDKNMQEAIAWTTAHQGLSPNNLSTNAEITQILMSAIERVSYDPSTINAAADQAMSLMESVLKGIRP